MQVKIKFQNKKKKKSTQSTRSAVCMVCAFWVTAVNFVCGDEADIPNLHKLGAALSNDEGNGANMR